MNEHNDDEDKEIVMLINACKGFLEQLIIFRKRQLERKNEALRNRIKELEKKNELISSCSL